MGKSNDRSSYGEERTFVMLKPDAMTTNRVLDILSRFERVGLKLERAYVTKIDREFAYEHYHEVYDKLVQKGNKPMAEAILDYIVSGEVMPTMWRGPNAILKARALGGPDMDPVKCNPGTIRFDYSSDSVEEADKQGRCVYNIVHVSDSKDGAKRELDLWFGPKAPIGYILDDRVTESQDDSQVKEYSRLPYDYIYKQVADCIGDTPVDLVKRVVKESHKQQIIYHGAKHQGCLKDLAKKGVLPLTPETNGSCWTSGVCTFFPPEGSSFFGYSGNHSTAREELCELVIVMGQHSHLVEKGLNIRPKEFPGDLDHVIIEDIVQPEDVSIIRVSYTDHRYKEKLELAKDTIKVGRAHRQEAERMLLIEIGKVLQYGYRPGQIIEVKKESR